MTIRLCGLIAAFQIAGLAAAAAEPTRAKGEGFLVHAAAKRPILVDYGLGEVTVRASDLGLGDGEVLVMDLATRFDEAILQLALQGISNRSGPRIWLDHRTVHWGHGEEHWKSYYTKSHRLRFRRIGTVAEVLPNVIRRFNGVILYDQDTRTAQVFLAMNLANLNDCLPVSRRWFDAHREVFDKVPIVEEIARDEFSHDAICRWMLDQLVRETNTGYCLSVNHSKPHSDGTEHGAYQSLDYGFFQRCFMHCFAPSGDVVDAADERFSRRLMALLDRPAIVMGWGENEWKMCHRISAYGHTWCATVAAPNLSFHAAMKPLSPPPFDHDTTPRIESPKKKVYVAIMSNEGDTCTALTQMHYRAWNHPARGAYPITWAMNPLYARLFPAAVEYYFRTRSENDFFSPGPSGCGYHYPAAMPEQYLDDLIRLTDRAHNESYNWDVLSFWGANSLPAVTRYPQRLPWLKGIALNRPVRPRVFVGPDSHRVPLLGHDPGMGYWINRFVREGKFDLDGLVARLDEVHRNGPLPRFLLMYGVVDQQVAHVKALGDTLDPDRFELVSYAQLYHLAGQVDEGSFDRQDTQPSASRNSAPWNASRWREPANWAHGADMELRQQDDGSLRLDTTKSWGLIEMNNLALPADVRHFRIRIGEMSDNVVYFVIFRGDFLGGLGRTVTTEATAFQARADQNLIYESRLRDNEVVLPSSVTSVRGPLTLQIKISSLHSDRRTGHVVIEEIQFR